MTTILGSNGSGGQSDLVKDSSEATFVADVIEQSKTTPVLVDFWAPWCGPCKQLGPAIEKVVSEQAGKVRLVKINVDENQGIAAQMRIQSIPAVFAFVDGKPVDGFMGALPEGQIKTFVEKVLEKAGGEDPKIDEYLNAAAELLSAGKAEEAVQLYMGILAQAPDNIPALGGLAKANIELGDIAAARAALDAAGDSDDPAIASARAALELAENPVDQTEITHLSAQVTSHPDDYEARFALANALNGANEREAAMEHLLYIIQAKRDWNDEAARKQLLTFFEAWGPTDEMTVAGRRKLSAILFS